MAGIRFEPKDTFWVVPALLLLIALIPLPYGYYLFLRLVVFFACAFAIWQLVLLESTKAHIWIAAFVVFGLIFNPFLRVHLTREIWMILNLIGAGLFLSNLYYLKRTGS